MMTREEVPATPSGPEILREAGEGVAIKGVSE